MSVPVPFTERRRRLPQAGRIRSGVKTRASNGKIRPKATETFRFTAPRRDDLDVIARLYGGEVRPWSDQKSEDRFEVLTEASEIRVALPPDPIGDGPSYEKWGGKGWERRCDGITAVVPQEGPDGREEVERPCLCRAAGRRQCKPKLRLQVLLPEVHLRGVWRFDTGSDAAVDEMPGMVDLILGMQTQGLAVAALRLDRRQSQGGANQFVVPALGILESLEGVMAGAARLTAGARPELDTARAALESGRYHPQEVEEYQLQTAEMMERIAPGADSLAEVVDAEVVVDDIDDALARLDPAQRGELADWWRRSQLPARPGLSEVQERQVLAELRRRGW
jgi:hypothetical protein